MKLPTEINNILLGWYGFPDEDIYCQVSTVSNNEPQIRTMKLYDISKQGQFVFITSTLSQKWQHLKKNPAMAICLLSSEGQCVINGSATLATNLDNQATVSHYWEMIPDYWHKYYLQQARLHGNTQIPDSFGIILLAPTSIDLVHINSEDYLKSKRQFYSLASNHWLVKDIALE